MLQREQTHVTNTLKVHFVLPCRAPPKVTTTLTSITVISFCLWKQNYLLYIFLCLLHALNLTSVRFIHIFVCSKGLPLFTTVEYLYEHTILYLLLSFEVSLSCFRFGAFMNGAGINILGYGLGVHSIRFCIVVSQN